MRSRSAARTPSTLILLVCSSVLVGGEVTRAQSPGWDTVGMIAGPADLVRVSGTHAYVAAGSTLSVVDISDPSAPKPRGTLKLPAPATAIAASGSIVYLALGLAGVTIVDAASPEKPAIVGSHKTRGETLRIAVSGSTIVVSDRTAGAVVIDVSDRARPKSIGAYYTDGYTRDVAMADSTAYIVDSTNDFVVVDISQRGEPKALATAQSTLTSSLVAVAPGGITARTAYVVGAGSLRAFDVSNPTAARPLGTAKVSQRAVGIVVDGRTAYIAAGGDGLQLLDLSDPAKPTVAGVFKTTGAARDVAVAGGLVFVAVAPSPAASGAAPAGVQILRASR